MSSSNSLRGADSVLTVNAGSSSLRLVFWSLAKQAEPLAAVNLSPAPDARSKVFSKFLDSEDLARPRLVIHRIVHGGTTLTSPTLLDESVLAEIKRLSSIAPLHNKAALKWVQAARQAFGSDLLQGACFDTSFYANLPEAAARYALPTALARRHGLRRYGFHGLAHQSMLEQWQFHCEPCAERKVISLQLGSGCSVTASSRGQPLETSMGFSPLEGLIMATRCGNVDPAAVLHLLDQTGMTTTQLGEILNRESGLLGVSGETSDMRVLLATDSAASRLAVDMFCHRIRHYIGAYLAVLGGAQAIVIGGGIGENSPIIRQRILEGFEWAGIRIDQRLNDSVVPVAPTPVHTGDSRVQIWVIPPNEAAVMADQAESLLQAGRNI
ncbi:acetate/propionate family kinase [Elongatibacter sediminis]|uniref:Acetate kinase n=1 Tax=Elongatibacter sediminis TaxID=3119006 RepID=A0AAW9RFD9_9GAMM